jgi:hypothetical protein
MLTDFATSQWGRLERRSSVLWEDERNAANHAELLLSSVPDGTGFAALRSGPTRTTRM